MELFSEDHEVLSQKFANTGEKAGFFLIDKVKGVNSFKLVMILRKVLGVKRVGFAGTLDPLATGLMVLAIGEYTKLLPYLEVADKIYEVTIRLDAISDTYDAEGQIFTLNPNSYSRPDRALVSKKIEQNFLGKIQQIPPKFSAIQINGQRAYDLARKGQVFQLKARTVEIFSVDVLKYDFPELKLKVHCSSGTYIRSLAFDLGKSMGVGGYVLELRRLKIGSISIKDAIQIDIINPENQADLMVAAEKLLGDLEKLKIDDKEYEVLAKGNFVDTNIYSQSGLDWDKPILAIYRNKVVGILETLENGQKLKFKKKLNIF